ncbi:MAG: tripartite tricarboxylate transporter TctB family protein [Paracoccaceae bacterium]
MILGLASLAILLRPDAEPEWPSLDRLAEILAAVVVMVLYAEFLDVAGFLIATTFATAYLTWRLGTGPVVAGGGAATAVGIYVIFRLILGLSLAQGPLGF